LSTGSEGRPESSDIKFLMVRVGRAFTASPRGFVNAGVNRPLS